MGENTTISWADATVNFWIGCQKVSPACDGCYAEAMMDHRYGRAQWGGPGKGAGTRALTSASTWALPIKLQRRAEKEGTRPFVFVNSLADIFDNAVPTEWRRDAFDVMRNTPRLVYLLLTKRPQNMVKLIEAAGGLPPNCALGTTVEDQPRAITLFHLASAAKDLKPLFTFASFEPLLSLVDPTRVVLHEGAAEFPDQPDIHMARFLFNALRGAASLGLPPLGWAITGGETDQGAHKARPTHPDWFRSLRDQCADEGVPFHHKQNGEWAPGNAFGLIEDGPITDSKGNVRDWMKRYSVCEDRADRLTAHSFTKHATDLVYRVGKARAGRLVDGVLHDARPAIS